MRIVTAHSAIEVRCTVSGAGAGFGLVGAMVAMDQPKGSVPTGLGKKVLGQIEEMTRECVDRRAGQAFSIRIVRPVNDQRFSDDVLARHESPVAAVERIIA